MNPPPKEFKICASHKIVGFPDGNILSWCPQIDLLAVSMNQTSIWVFRLDGERVYSVNNRAKVLHFQWSHSGKFFALSGTDRTIKVYDTNSGKLVNQFSTNADSDISLMSWVSINVTDSISQDGNFVDFEDLFRVEILSKMPKLSNEVDPGSTDASGFTESTAKSQFSSASVTNTTTSDEVIDYLLVASGDSSLSVTFNNLHTVSNISLPNKELKVLQHAICQDFFQQYLLVQDTSSQLHLQELCIDVEGSRSRKTFFESIRYASQITSIINHINDQLCTMQKESKEFLSLYDRYLSNFKDTLYADVDVMTHFPSANEVEDKMVLNIGEMLLTGLIPKSTKDYWLNQFGERGLLKLSALGNAVYDNSRKVMFTQLILGSEKLIILLSYLEALAKTAKILKEDCYGITLQSVQKAISLTQDLVKHIYAMIWKLNTEHEYFNQYLNWVKVEVIEKLSKEDTDPEAFFTEHPTLDFKASSIMEYLSEYMFDSVLSRELEFDCSEHETLLSKSPTIKTLKSHITDLSAQLKNTLVDMERYFAGHSVFKPTIPLHATSDGAQSYLQIHSSAKWITSVNENTLQITRMGNDTSTMELIFPGKIKWHKLMTEDDLLILYEVDEKESVIENIRLPFDERTIHHDEMILLRALEFNPNTLVKRPSFVTTNGAPNKSDTRLLIMDDTKKDYIILRVYS